MDHRLIVFGSKLRAIKNAVVRPWRVTKAQRAHVKTHPGCEMCSSTDHCQGHHIFPYHKYPARAADPGNFRTLCMSKGRYCHLLGGHGGDYHFYNPNVVADAAEALAHPDRLQAIIERARVFRKPDK